MKLTTESTENTERATPETDALEQKQSSEGCPQWNDMMRWVREHAALACKLERERDEAREAFVIATDQMVIAHGKLREANKERDEARAELEKMKETKQELMQMVYGRNWFEQDLLKQNAKLRAELDQLKESGEVSDKK
jgi:predicted house-cleaning NTP pyrophosphatase (Maf/HAM1 superfamily)